MLKKMFVDAFAEHGGSGLKLVLYNLLYHTVEDIQRFERLYVLNSSFYEWFNFHHKKGYKRTSQIKRKKSNVNSGRDGQKVQERAVIPEKKDDKKLSRSE